MESDRKADGQSWKLPAIGLVGELGEEERGILGGHGNFSSLAAGQVVIEQGAAQDALYFVVSGVLHAKRSDGGREVLLGEIRMGEWFGEVNIFDPGEASATVRAVSPSQIWRITKGEFEDFLNENTAAAGKVLVGIATLLSRRLRGVTARLVGRAEFESLWNDLR
jgi:CRP/FNR family transcriptional regulator, cyclic AMP receptor protein